MSKGLGSFLSGFSGGYQSGADIKRDRRDQELKDKALDTLGQQRQNGGYMPLGDSDGYYGPVGGGGGGPGGRRMISTDPVNTNLPRHQRAFLNAVALGESAGAYDIRYTPQGGKTFDLNGEHPRIFEKGPHGPSSAAGRYQFTATTWDDMGGGAFTPERQDEMAWNLAVRDYGKRTGRDLNADLIDGGLTPQITRALAPTWAAFNSKPDRYISAYRDSYGRFTSAARETNRPPTRSVAEAADPQPAELPSLGQTGGRLPARAKGINTTTMLLSRFKT